MNTSIETNKLFNMLLDSESEDECLTNENVCLISGEKLTNNNITLPCNHTFNYNSIYDAVIIQKKTYNPLNHVYLRINELQCPYCRTIHNKLLPFIPKKKHTQRVRGVTGPKQFCMKHLTCEWLFKSGKNKGCLCAKEAYKTYDGVFCKKHHIIIDGKTKKITPDLIITPEIEELKKYTVVQLKDILHKKNLKKTGNKLALIHRIVLNK